MARTITTLERDAERTAVTLSAARRMGIEDGEDGAPYSPPSGRLARIYGEGYAVGFARYLASR